MYLTKIMIIPALTASLLLAAGGSGNSALPNGKPFRSIQSSFDDLQSQIDAMIGDTNPLEERVTALESALANLQARDAELLALIEANAGDLTAMQAEMANNTALISMMQSQINQLETFVAQKQNIVNGTCAEGSSIRQIMEDGSVVCEPDDIGTVGSLQVYTSSNTITVPAHTTAGALASCPAGTVVTGGGYFNLDSSIFVYNFTPNGNGWMVYVNSQSDYTSDIIVYALCARLLQ